MKDLGVGIGASLCILLLWHSTLIFAQYQNSNYGQQLNGHSLQPQQQQQQQQQQQPGPYNPQGQYQQQQPYNQNSSPSSPRLRRDGQMERWRPRIGQKIQVILDRRVIKLSSSAPLVPDNADIWDLDLFDTPKETIDILHAHGKRVFCYMSAGGSESWRSDFNQIQPADLGVDMAKWKGEKYLNLKSPTVWTFMQNRIRQAYEKGCDAIDPDNLDPFNDDSGRGGGFYLTQADTIAYVRKFAAETHRYGMSMGMKNAEDILPNITDVIDFAVNEECTTYEQGCKQYVPLLNAGKPVFHFEYVKVDNSQGYPNIKSVYGNWTKLSSPEILAYYCLRNNYGNMDFIQTPYYTDQFSTVIKSLDLGGWVMYCDGSWAETPTAQTLSGPERSSSSSNSNSKGSNKGSGNNNGSNGSSSGGSVSSSNSNRPWWDPFGFFGSKSKVLSS